MGAPSAGSFGTMDDRPGVRAIVKRDDSAMN